MTDPSSPRLFHLAPATAFDLALRSGAKTFEPPSLATEGLVHLSFAHQIRGTLNAHFATERTLVLLEVDLTGAAGELREEASRAGALFPHFYGPLPMSGLRRRWVLTRTDSGWTIPFLGNSPDTDYPSAEVTPQTPEP